MAEDTLRFVSGQVVAGKYRIEKQIGAGGMGVVAVATHVSLGQRVAIKFLNDDAMKSQDVITRFEREAKASVQLKSEHVARVLDVGILETGAPYMVMEYLDGKDLSSVIESGVLVPAPLAVEYVMQACEAIAEAHRLGIVHRDLKPANLFLTQRVDGRPLVKVLDFGISKLVYGDAMDTKLTSTTAVIGSPSYMSPEQLRASRDVDHRGDIWSLGVILFELLSGSLPFEAANVMELCMRVASDMVPRLETRRPDLPTGLCDVVAHCLEKDPSRRFQSVAELVNALAPYQALEMSTTAERIARVSGGSMPPNSQPQLDRADRSSARVVVSGGTSVSWGKTEALTNRPPKPSNAGAFVAAGLTAILLLGGGAGGAVYFTKYRAAHQDLLPSDRTNLPPMGTMPLPSGSSPQGAGTAASTLAPTVAPAGLPTDRAPMSGPAVTAPGPNDNKGPNDKPLVAGGANGAGGASGPVTTGRKPGPAAGQATGPAGGPKASPAQPKAGSDDILPDSRK